MQPETASIQPTAALPLNSHSPRTARLSRASLQSLRSTLPSGLRQLKARIMRRGLTGANQNRHNGNTPPVPAEAWQKSQLSLVHLLHLGPKLKAQQARVSLCASTTGLLHTGLRLDQCSGSHSSHISHCQVSKWTEQRAAVHWKAELSNH